MPKFPAGARLFLAAVLVAFVAAAVMSLLANNPRDYVPTRRNARTSGRRSVRRTDAPNCTPVGVQWTGGMGAPFCVASNESSLGQDSISRGCSGAPKHARRRWA
jgi:hypothetical protein